MQGLEDNDEVSAWRNDNTRETWIARAWKNRRKRIEVKASVARADASHCLDTGCGDRKTSATNRNRIQQSLNNCSRCFLQHDEDR